MSRAPDQLAPSWLPRQQRRRIDRELRKLLRRDVCSVCGSAFKHNSRTASGLDGRGNVVLAGECCSDRVAQIFGAGFYTTREYDFLKRRDAKPVVVLASELPVEQIVEAITASQGVIAAADKQLDGVERRVRARGVSLLDYPWKSDDRDWFERNPSRSHRARVSFLGEVDEEVIKTPVGYALIVLVRLVNCNVDLLPLPDNEAVAHAMFDLAVRREAVPPDGEVLRALIKKYTTPADGRVS